MSLKDKTVTGISWSFVESIARSGISFIFGIIMARLLSPREFGLVGMTTFFVAFSQPFIISGLSQALVRKLHCTQEDYSTVFFFNLATSITAYIILFFTAGAISSFFNEPQLILILRVLSLTIVINSVSLVQMVILTKKIDFKLLTKITIISTVCAGVIAIFLAYLGFGVWSLVIKHLIISTLSMLLLLYWNRWRPSLLFSWQSFKEMYSFGWKLMVSGLLNTVQVNIFKLVIGKYYTASDLGFYTRAEMFKKIPAENITRVIQRVSYPVLSSIQDEKNRLKANYRKLIKSTMLITLVSMLSLAAVARPLIITLIGEQWLPSVLYLQLLCFVGIFFPLIAINANMMQVQGRSDLILKINILRKILLIPVVIIGIIYGISSMIIGLIIESLIAYFLYSYWSGKMIGYTSVHQIKDIVPSFLLASTVGIFVFLIGHFLQASPIVTLIMQVLVFIGASLAITEVFKMEDYLFLKGIVMEKVFQRFKQT